MLPVTVVTDQGPVGPFGVVDLATGSAVIDAECETVPHGREQRSKPQPVPQSDFCRVALRQRLTDRRPANTLRVSSWNCRWLPPTSCPRGRAKALAIQQAVRQGAAVLLQETHLDAAAAKRL